MSTNGNAPTAANGRGIKEGLTNCPHYSQPSTAPVHEFLGRLQGVRKASSGHTARCPAHDDRHNSLSVSEGDDGRVLIHCHAGCESEDIVRVLGLKARDLFPHSPAPTPNGSNGKKHRPEGGTHIPRNDGATAQHPAGVTLESYAERKRLPATFLERVGLSTIYVNGRPALRIPYGTPDGGPPPCVRRRRALEKTDEDDNRFDWQSNPKPRLCLYGLDRLDSARKAGMVVIVEGESDCHTLWYHDIPALGLPGAGNWREGRDVEHLEGLATIYVLIEPDKGGAAVKRWLSDSAIRDRAMLLDLHAATGFKDPSDLHCDDPEAFPSRWRAALETARPWVAVEREEAEAAARAAWERASHLVTLPNILERFAVDVAAAGVVREQRTVKLLYLALTSRFLGRPVSIAMKGPSSAGKSHATEKVLTFFPASAYYSLTASSEKALAYGEEPLSHRFLVIFEAAGMSSETGTYLIRSLLSEGRICYETVEKTREGLRPRRIEREGPTGLITTTTAIRLHPENETRFFSVPATDTPEQTAAIIEHIFDETERSVDREPWIALQEWLATANHRVTIPFGKALAGMIPPTAVRLRRDAKALHGLISAHAILHQANRQTDDAGRIVATFADYEAVRELVADLFAEGAEAAVSDTIRETVAAVAELLANGRTSVNKSEIARALKLDRSSGKRRVDDALAKGYLRDENEGKQGTHARIVLGDPLPEDVELLPSVERLWQAHSRCCTVAATPAQIHAPSLMESATMG